MTSSTSPLPWWIGSEADPAAVSERLAAITARQATQTAHLSADDALKDRDPDARSHATLGEVLRRHSQ